MLKDSFSQVLDKVDAIKREFNNKLDFNKNEIQSLSLKLSFDETTALPPAMPIKSPMTSPQNSCGSTEFINTNKDNIHEMTAAASQNVEFNQNQSINEDLTNLSPNVY